VIEGAVLQHENDKMPDLSRHTVCTSKLLCQDCYS
jgi:hypothetical protein